MHSQSSQVSASSLPYPTFAFFSPSLFIFDNISIFLFLQTFLLSNRQFPIILSNALLLRFANPRRHFPFLDVSFWEMGPRGRLRLVVELRVRRGRFGIWVWVDESRYFAFVFKTGVGGAEVRGGGFAFAFRFVASGRYDCWRCFLPGR
jgi:hypothetical protein